MSMEPPVCVLTIDVEDWFHLLEVESTITETQWRNFPSRVETGTGRILEALDQAGVTATFFCLGWIAQKFPHLIRAIKAAGHDIGSHSYSHTMVREQTPEQFRDDLVRSLGVIEDTIGEKVNAYRAPGFSITPDTSWAFPILAKHGIEFDSSLFLAQHAHGGFSNYGAPGPAVVSCGGMFLKEFPVTAGNLAGIPIAFSGGGYFRALPYPLVKRMIRRSNYVMTYFHPRDFDPGQPRLPGLPWQRMLKTYIGIHSAFGRFQRLLRDFHFISLSDLDSRIDWEKQPCVSVDSIPDNAPALHRPSYSAA